MVGWSANICGCVELLMRFIDLGKVIKAAYDSEIGWFYGGLPFP